MALRLDAHAGLSRPVVGSEAEPGAEFEADRFSELPLQPPPQAAGAALPQVNHGDFGVGVEAAEIGDPLIALAGSDAPESARRPRARRGSPGSHRRSRGVRIGRFEPIARSPKDDKVAGVACGVEDAPAAIPVAERHRHLLSRDALPRVLRQLARSANRRTPAKVISVRSRHSASSSRGQGTMAIDCASRFLRTFRMRSITPRLRPGAVRSNSPAPSGDHRFGLQCKFRAVPPASVGIDTGSGSGS